MGDLLALTWGLGGEISGVAGPPDMVWHSIRRRLSIYAEAIGIAALAARPCRIAGCRSVAGFGEEGCVWGERPLQMWPLMGVGKATSKS